MWIDTLSAGAGAIAVIITTIVSVAGAVRWVVRREMAPVRGEIHSLGERFNSWIEAHEIRHDDERRQIAAAFRRNELSPPDGWDRTRTGDRGQ